MIQYLLFLWMGLGLYSMWTAGRHRWGWLLVVLFNIGWVLYGYSIGEWALGTQNLFFGLIALRNYFVNRTSNLPRGNESVVD